MSSRIIDEYIKVSSKPKAEMIKISFEAMMQGRDDVLDAVDKYTTALSKIGRAQREAIEEIEKTRELTIEEENEFIKDNEELFTTVWEMVIAWKQELWV